MQEIRFWHLFVAGFADDLLRGHDVGELFPPESRPIDHSPTAVLAALHTAARGVGTVTD